MNPEKKFLNILKNWEFFLLVILALVVFTNSMLSPYFWDIYNLFDSTYNFCTRTNIYVVPNCRVALVVSSVGFAKRYTMRQVAIFSNFAVFIDNYSAKMANKEAAANTRAERYGDSEFEFVVFENQAANWMN